MSLALLFGKGDLLCCYLVKVSLVLLFGNGISCVVVG